MTDFSNIPDLTEEQFRRFAALIHKEAGITLKPAKITLLSNRLRKRLRSLNILNFDDYYSFIQRKTPESEREMVHFLEAVTTNESYFWRAINNFDLLKETILPELLSHFKGEELVFWSAGCSTGEEPYNLAMELTESMKIHGVFRYRIFASDISERVVEFAKAGRYSGRKIEKIPPVLLNRYFVPVAGSPDEYEVRKDIKEKVIFRKESIFTSDLKNLHMIFCRNVMIYFSRDDQERLVNRFYTQLLPGGFLIVGHSESLHMMDTGFKSLHYPKGVAYRKMPGTAEVHHA